VASSSEAAACGGIVAATSDHRPTVSRQSVRHCQATGERQAERHRDVGGSQVATRRGEQTRESPARRGLEALRYTWTDARLRWELCKGGVSNSDLGASRCHGRHRTLGAVSLLARCGHL